MAKLLLGDDFERRGVVDVAVPDDSDDCDANRCGGAGQRKGGRLDGPDVLVERIKRLVD